VSESRVSSLRARSAADTELEWYFNRAHCDLGIRSNFQRALGWRCPADNPTPEDVVEAAHAYRLVLRWLLAISDHDAGVLEAAYTLRPWPPRLWNELGRVTGVVVRLACALDAWQFDRRTLALVEDIRAVWLLGEHDRGFQWEFSPLVRLRREGETLLARALAAYARARGRRRCVVWAS
jgi:hypothetical protein